jgi:hypothetical protein
MRRRSISFNWAANVDESPGPVPTFIDYGPTMIEQMPAVESLHPPPPMTSLQPTPLPTGNLIPPLQPIHATPKHAVTLPKHDVAPHAHNPTTDVPTMPRARTPSHIPSALCPLLPHLRYPLRATPPRLYMAHVTCLCSVQMHPIHGEVCIAAIVAIMHMSPANSHIKGNIHQYTL